MAKMGIGCGVMVLNQGKVLLGRRHDDPEKASSELQGEGTWTMPGGKVDFGECLQEAALRELQEETGIKLNKEQLKLISLTNDISSKAHFVTAGFLCQTDQEPSVMEPDEIVEWQWFELDNLPNPIFFPAEKILKNYSDKEIYKH